MAGRRRRDETRRIVVDANVLRAAASTDLGPLAGRQCRALLLTVYEVCHRAVVSPALDAEYGRHASRFGVRWLSAMTKKGKRVRTDARETSRARGWLQRPGWTPAERRALAKDLHLVLAALETGSAILSSDDEARALFQRIDALREIGWARAGDANAVTWLRRGADPGRARLGSA